MADVDLERPPIASLPFTLRQIQYFVAIAETGSISRAAMTLHASDSAVADALSAMERALGATLFSRRRSHGATLTSDGLAILPIAYRILSDAEELSAAVGRDPASVTGPVRVGALGTVAPAVIPRLIVAMAERFPNVRIDYRSGDLPDLLEAMSRAELDCVMTFDIDVPPELHRRPLLSTMACIVLSADHPLAGSSSLSLSALADEPMVLLDIEASRTHTLELMSSRGLTPRIAHRTDNYELCRALVGRGLGFSLLMSRGIPLQTWDGSEVVFVPIEPQPRDVAVIAAWMTAPPPPRLSALVETAADVYRGRPLGLSPV